MPIFSKWTDIKSEVKTLTLPNYWDAIAVCLVFAIIVLLAWGAKQMTTPYHVGQVITISLSPEKLPYYALRSVLRMLIALTCSLTFTFIVGAAAAKSRHAERIIIPIIDILQSVPVLGYLSITVVAFISLFPNNILGPECAAIFAIFTAQVWNMTLSFYQSLRTLPEDLKEAATIFHLSAWQRFWRLEVPFAMPGLLWNAMMSMSASWFFVVASESISVANQNITLPGIGSYIATAVGHADIRAVIYAILTMFVVILLYDQILFRPLNQWIVKFKFEQVSEEKESSAWVISLFQRTKLLRRSHAWLVSMWDNFVNLKIFIRPIKNSHMQKHPKLQQSMLVIWYILLAFALIFAIWVLGHFIFTAIAPKEIVHVAFLGIITAARVIILIIISSLVWIPLGVWIGLRPKIAEYAQPTIQFLASFPVNLFYPIAVLLIVTYHLNINVWTSPLMILGTQWYIAFNVIAGTLALPKDLRQAASIFNVRGFLWWRRLILPGIFPFYLTGAITAAGGAWNASIIAESVSWGSTKIEAVGLGAYITHYSNLGDFRRLALGIGIMCIYVVVINKLIWRPLYRLAKERFQLN
jgi:NitT/TauT family transport system permease protein